MKKSSIFPFFAKENLNVAIPSTVESLIFSALAIIINSLLVMVSGTKAVAVYTASMMIVELATPPLIGIGTAVLTVAGVAYGARNIQNLKITYSYSIRLSFLLSIIIGAIIVIFSNQIASIFSSHLAPQIASSITLLSLYVLTMPLGIMSAMVFRGVGKGVYSLIITLLRLLFLETILAYIFGILLGWGVKGIYIGIVLGGSIGGMIGYAWTKLFIRRFEKITTDFL